MAGFRTFATGEVLTAANVNDFLMSQSVMRFADADARTAALGANVVEGMLTYNLDTDQLEVFDGTNFVIAAPEPPPPTPQVIKQIVSARSTAPFGSNSTAFLVPPGLTVNITPKSDTSSLWVQAMVNVGHQATSAAFRSANMALFRDGQNQVDPDTPGNRTPSFMYFNTDGLNEPGRDMRSYTVSMVLPSVDTIQTTFDIRLREGSTLGSYSVNRSHDDNDQGTAPRGVSQIIVTEFEND